MNRPRRSEHIREALIQEGIEQLSIHGYHGTGIKQILDQVNVPKGSFYNFFASKEAFVAELIGHYSQDLLGQIREYIEGEGKHLTPAEQLRAIYQYSLQRYADAEFKKSCLVGSMAAEISAESDMCRVQLDRAAQQWHDFFTQVFEKGQQFGEIRNDLNASSIAGVYWATWEGALIKMKMSANIKPAQRIMELMLDWLLKPQSE